MATALHPFQIGKISATVIADDVEPIGPDRFNAIFARPEDEAIRNAFAQLPTQQFSFNCLHLDTGSHQVLIDTGSGNHPPRPHGFLFDGLKKAGVNAANIDTIVLTHFHIDHIAGLVDDEGALEFPNSTLVVALPEYEYWTREDVVAKLEEFRAATLKSALHAYESAGRIRNLAPDGAIVDGLAFTPTPGHTPGHSGVRVESDGVTLLHVADAVHFPLQLQFLDCVPRFDVEPEQAMQTRRQLLERASTEQCLVAAYHFAFPGLGKIVQNDGKLEWRTETSAAGSAG